MAFGFGKNIAVLESKFDMYENLSKEMLDKLERAVTSISENSNKISVILERHENKLEESEKTDALLLKMLDEVKEENKRDHKEVKLRISKTEERIQDLSKFRWQVGGVIIVASLLIGAATSGIASNLLTSVASPDTIVEQVK
jgi:predicted  nucleic acid-binding Zn-ribbon protein